MPPFDADQFMSQTIDQPLEIDYKICPVGEYRAMVDDFTSEAVEQIDFEYKRGPKAGSPGSMTKFSCPFVIQDDSVKVALGREKILVFKSFILDMTDSGGLDFGVNKNVELGKLRAAAGQNDAGPWTLGKLRDSGPYVVKVVHRSGKRKDGSDFTNAEIDRIVKLT